MKHALNPDCRTLLLGMLALVDAGFRFEAQQLPSECNWERRLPTANSC